MYDMTEQKELSKGNAVGIVMVVLLLMLAPLVVFLIAIDLAALGIGLLVGLGIVWFFMASRK